MNIINPRDLKIVNQLPPVAKRGDKISIDSEFFGQTKSRLHRPHGTFAFLGCSFDGETVYYITDENQIQEFFNRLDAGVWIFHHTKYDVTQLRRFANIPSRKLLWDTMLIEQIMYSGYYTDFGLNDLARRHLDIYMSKEIRKEFSDDTVLSREQIEYASVDVVATWKIYQSQRAIIDETDLEIWKEIERPFLWSIIEMGGVKLDTEKWIALAEKNGVTASNIQEKYGRWTEVQGKRSVKKVFEGLNLNSPAQVKAHITYLGYKVKSTDVEALEELQDCDFAREMLEYRRCAKRASTYGKQFIEDYVEADGKIYADIYQIGAETGRTSCRAPNLQNQPHEFDYRDCFISEDGRGFLIGDYSSQEPRFAAYFSQDRGLIDALHGKEKLYIRIAREALGLEIKKGSKEYDDVKSTILGLFYGMSAKGLAKRIGCSEIDAQAMIDKILEAYPGVEDYMNRQKKAKDFVQSVYGRKIWLNKYSYQWERNALNAPIQSSAADAMKMAASRFTQMSEEHDWRIVLLVHDEIVISIPESDCEEAKKLLTYCMVSVADEMHEGIKGAIEIFPETGCGKSWGAKG